VRKASRGRWRWCFRRTFCDDSRGPNNHRKDKAGVPGENDTDEGAIDVTQGGTAIPYWLEDPFLRKEYEETLRKEGVKSQMDVTL
jgi:hypothetical protein